MHYITTTSHSFTALHLLSILRCRTTGGYTHSTAEIAVVLTRVYHFVPRVRTILLPCSREGSILNTGSMNVCVNMGVCGLV